MNEQLLTDFLLAQRYNFSKNESMQNHTSIKIGGDAKFFVKISSTKKLINLIVFLKQNNIDYFVLGNGTNILVSDNGYKGVVIKLGGNLKGYKIKKNLLTAFAGESLFDLNKVCAKNGLSGLEWSFGIPGSVGGATRINAGAYEHSIGEFIKNVLVFDGEKLKRLTKNELKFGYRTSEILNQNYVVISTTFELKYGEKEDIEKLQKEYLLTRLSSQPYNKNSAGSVFKKNKGVAVSKLIDEQKMKGFSVNDAVISEKHAGFIINNGKATCKDTIKLIKYIQKRLLQEYNIFPELEIEILGEVEDEIL